MVSAGATPANQPILVSCILPTRNRAATIRLAIRSYLAQTYQRRELVIVDNGDDETESLVPARPDIRYVKVTGQNSTGQMRNLCCEEARGEVICHFDSDDWSVPTRIEDQLHRMGDFGAVTGYSTMLFYDARQQKSYLWSMGRHCNVRYALGTSLLYRREWWQKFPFDDMRVGEDFKFFQQLQREANGRVTVNSGDRMMVALIHEDQTCLKDTKSQRYQLVGNYVLPEKFLCDLTS